MDIKGIDNVLDYLSGKGFKVSRATLFRHRKDGKLPVNADGTFAEAAVFGYATLHLKRLDSEIDDIQREKVMADARRSKAMAKLAEERARKESGTHVHIDEFGRALAMRAMLLKQDLFNLAHSQTPALIDLCDGGQEKAPDIVQFLLNEFEIMLGRYAEPGATFKVVKRN